MNNAKLALIALVLTACGAKPSAPAPTSGRQICNNTSAPKNLLSVGDSISMGYVSYLAWNLCGQYNVTHVKAFAGDPLDQNAQGTTFTLANIDRWLNQAGPQDVIVWNNGIWNSRDPAFDPQSPGNATDLATYQNELIQISQKLKATGARVIFVTTTDIPNPEFFNPDGDTFLPGRDIDENAIAESVLPILGVEVRDIHDVGLADPTLHHSDDPIHFNDRGCEVLGNLIANFVNE